MDHLLSLTFSFIDKSNSNSDVLIDDRSEDSDRGENIFELNNTLSSTTVVTTDVAAKTCSISEDYETNSLSQIESVLSGNHAKIFRLCPHD